MLGEEEQEDGQVARTVYAMDGSCRQCKFLMLEGKYSREDGVPSVSCPVCGNVNDLSTGEVTTFLPANNPVQWGGEARQREGRPAAPRRAADARVEGGASSCATRRHAEGRQGD